MTYMYASSYKTESNDRLDRVVILGCSDEDLCIEGGSVLWVLEEEEGV